MGNDARYVQEVGKQPDQSCVAPESSFDHICPNNPILTCNCTDPKFCVELGNDPDRQHRDIAEQDGFSDNLEYTGIPIPTTKREGKKLGWPCVVVGAICETRTSATESLSRSEHRTEHTECDVDAGHNHVGLNQPDKL
jgi:hypothetical protein